MGRKSFIKGCRVGVTDGRLLLTIVSE